MSKISFSVEKDLVAQTEKLDASIKRRLQKASAMALNDTAFKARAHVQAEMKSIFRDPEPITLRSVLVTKADPAQSIDEMSATVYIVDHLGRGIAPAKYLQTQEKGGERRQKRAERVLSARGYLGSSQFMTPGPNAPLDSHGQVAGSAMQQILSRVKAFGEMGFTANATAGTTKRLKKQGVATHQRTGTNFFVAKSKSGGFMGVFQLVSKGKIKPVFWFDRKPPTYTARFPFQAIVGKHVGATLMANLRKALESVMDVKI